MNISQLIAAAVLVIQFPGVGSAAGLQSDTLEAWGKYVASRDLRAHAARWSIEDSPARAARVKSGEIVVAPVVGRGTQGVPGGLIHDWAGTVFIPRATLSSVLDVVSDFNRYQDIYRPLVVKSATISCSEQEQEYSMVWRHHVMMIDAAESGLYDVHFHAVDARRAYQVTESVGIQEIQHFGQPDQRLLAPDTGSGFMWRIRSVSRYEERDGGVYLQLEVIALTRDIPPSMRWIVGPIVNHLSINSLRTTLRETRDAVMSSAGVASGVCPAPQTDGVKVMSANREAPSKAQSWR